MILSPAITYMVPEPYGVALVIASWNYPVYTSIPGVVINFINISLIIK